MSKLYCATCKYYDFNACEGVDWCRLNDEETGICGYCEREFEDLDEATEHYDAVVEENNKLYSLNCEMAGKVAELEHRLSNCIEPKFKQGDKCYVIETRYVNEVEYFGENIDGIITFEEGCRCGCTPDRYSVEKRENVFATEEEAKAKLEELKNE